MPRIHLAIGEDHLRSTGKPRRDEVEIGSNGKSEHKMDDWGLGVPYFRKSPYHDIKIDLDLHVLTYIG